LLKSSIGWPDIVILLRELDISFIFWSLDNLFLLIAKTKKIKKRGKLRRKAKKKRFF
jgi:hypothetical protein